jgi:hypothetical protein
MPAKPSRGCSHLAEWFRTGGRNDKSSNSPTRPPLSPPASQAVPWRGPSVQGDELEDAIRRGIRRRGSGAQALGNEAGGAWGEMGVDVCQPDSVQEKRAKGVPGLSIPSKGYEKFLRSGIVYGRHNFRRSARARFCEET